MRSSTLLVAVCAGVLCLAVLAAGAETSAARYHHGRHHSHRFVARRHVGSVHLVSGHRLLTLSLPSRDVADTSRITRKIEMRTDIHPSITVTIR